MATEPYVNDAENTKRNDRYGKNRYILAVILIILTVLCLVRYSLGDITSISCSGDNMRCYGTTYYKNTATLHMPKMFIHTQIKTNMRETYTIKFDQLSTASGYFYRYSKPTLKYTCDEKTFYLANMSNSTRTSITFKIRPPCRKFNISNFQTYSATRLYNLMDETVSENVNVTYLYTNRTPVGSIMPIITASNNHWNLNKTNIVMVARLHTTEMYSSYYVEGLLKAINDTLDYANYLIIPMGNIDGVKEAVIQFGINGRDYNDHWNDTTIYEIELMKKNIKEFNDTYGRIDLYIDWHGGNMGGSSMDTIQYTDLTERPLVMTLQSTTSFRQRSLINASIDKSRAYMKSNYNCTSLAFEIQHNKEETIHSTQNMELQGRKVLDAIGNYYNWTGNKSNYEVWQ